MWRNDRLGILIPNTPNRKISFIFHEFPFAQIPWPNQYGQARAIKEYDIENIYTRKKAMKYDIENICTREEENRWRRKRILSRTAERGRRQTRLYFPAQVSANFDSSEASMQVSIKGDPQLPPRGFPSINKFPDITREAKTTKTLPRTPHSASPTMRYFCHNALYVRSPKSLIFGML